MPQRFLRPGIVTSLRLARCSPWAQLLYYKILSLVDDFSRYDAHPTVLSRAAFPYGDHKGRIIKDDQIEAWLTELESARLDTSDAPCLTRYQVNGTRYLMLHRWQERPRVNSRFPDPTLDSKFCQMFPNVVRCQQMTTSANKCFQMKTDVGPLALALASTIATERENVATPAEVQSSRTQAGALLAKIAALEARKTSLTPAEREDLREKRRELSRIQDEQSKGKFNHKPSQPPPAE